MQQAIQYRDWVPTAAVRSPVTSSGEPEIGGVRKLVAENAVVVFARRGCCMCHVVKLLLHGQGVSPSIFDVDDQNEGCVVDELSRIANAPDAPKFPAVFVGGELLGGLEDVVGAHISGELVPRLREARALWL